MFKLIVEKELRDQLGTPRFAAAFGVTSVLILLAFFMGAQNYQVMQMRYEAAQQENVRQITSLTTDQWLQVSPTLFVPPSPLAALVSGVSNDVGRSLEVAGRGELNLENSHYSDDTASAVFRLLDLEFVFTIVFSLFAILFCYNAINGEKEQGTLRLVFSNAVPRDQYILGKIVGSFLALGVPLLVPILLGALLFIAMGVPMSGEDWLRLGGITLLGMLYFGVFMMIALFVSAITKRSASAFIVLLVAWIFAVFVIPRTAVLFAGRAVDVPSYDEIAYQKRQKLTQLVQEDMEELAKALGGESSGGSFSITMTEESEDPGEAQERMQERMQRFMAKQQELSDRRDEEMGKLNEQLNTDRYNRQVVQQQWAFGLARISPVSAFTLAITTLAGTSLSAEAHFMDAARSYQQSFKTFQEEKAGMSSGTGFMIVMRTSDEEEEEPEPIDIAEVPQFSYEKASLQETMPATFWNVGLLFVFSLVFFVAAYVAFLRYDLR